jgi:CheY-like chemotaxis protein
MTMAKKILIIDDEKDMRIYLDSLLSQAGYETSVAENGLLGFEQARTWRPDLITLDILMPKRSGVKTYSELRNSPDLKDIPVIVLTGLSRQDDFFGQELGQLPQPEAIVEKPIERDAFLKKVDEIIGA